jgi:hypothetical protein
MSRKTDNATAATTKSDGRRVRAVDVAYFAATALSLAVVATLGFYLFAPATWLEAIERPIVLECSIQNAVVKTISFTPRAGRIMYDGQEVDGTVSSAVVRLQFKNVDGDHCDWTISRVSGEGRTSCKDKGVNYSRNPISCLVNPKLSF